MKRILFVTVAAFSISACATWEGYYDKTIFNITKAECKMFSADEYGKCMREHYPRVEEDYSWERPKDGTTSSDGRSTIN